MTDRGKSLGRIAASFRSQCGKIDLDGHYTDFSGLLKPLAELKLEEGLELDVRLPSTSGFGGESVPCLKCFGDRKRPMTMDPEDDFRPVVLEKDAGFGLDPAFTVPFTETGIWEAYLLTQAWHMLPLWWHANYSNHTYIFRLKDFEEIHTGAMGYPVERRDRVILSIYSKDEKMLPKVTLMEDDTAEIVYHYWNDWSGLEKCTVTAHRDGNSVWFSEERTENLVKYSCGICY